MHNKKEVSLLEIEECVEREFSYHFPGKGLDDVYNPIETVHDAQIRNVFRDKLKLALKTELLITIGFEMLDKFMLMSSTPRETARLVYDGLSKKK